LSKEFKTSEKTFWGPRVTLQYTRLNLRGMGETITLAALGARLIQRGSFSYLDPSFFETSWSSNFTISGEHNEENPIFSEALGEVGYQLQKPLDARKTQNLFVRYNYRDSNLTHLLIPDLVPPEDRHVRLSTVAATYTHDTRDNILDAHRGIYQSYEFAVNPEALGSSVSFARFLGQTSYYWALPKSIVWANSIRLGLEQEFAGSHVPVSEFFFTGGGSTIRGFPLNGAGPQRTISACGTTGCFPINVPVGGKQLLILNTEFRIPVPIKKGLGIVAFYDGGNVFPDVGFHGQYTNTLGFGVRYATPVGPVRVDIGHNLNAPPGIKSTQIFITLGQAF
jgi:outer membrane protein assembly factor BamA